MRFMVIVSGPDHAGPPNSEMIARMGKFNEELLNAGVMKAGEGLLPTAKGARVSFKGKDRSVSDGPFAEAKEVIGGFWIWEVKDKAEAIEWARKIPFEDGSVDIRQVAEVEDFPVDDISRETLEKEKVWQEELRTR